MKEFEAKVYEAFKTEIGLISKAEDKDLSVATSMFIANVERGGNYKYVDNAKAKAKLDEIRAELDEE